MNHTQLPKIIAVVGPTASGKTRLGIELAKKFNGEVISADSRQVYKKMDIGTAKPRGIWADYEDIVAYMVEGVPHHMVDIVDPGEVFNVAHFKELALRYISNILHRGKLPIVVGGTGLYVWSLVDNLLPPQVSPNKKLRQSLEKKSLPKLVELLKKLDPLTAEHIDGNNIRRVMRALEVVILSGRSFYQERKKEDSLFCTLQIGVNISRDNLDRNIHTRVDQQVNEGLVEEVEGLMKQKYGWHLPSMNGIGYKQIGAYLRGELDITAAVELVKRDTRHYARRQLTWFRRDKRIVWMDDFLKIEAEVARFLK
jgi:tRNA dimethylallyltransferase